MLRLREKGALMAIGGAGYTLIELAWRGKSHWTMTLAGGVCFAGFYHICEKAQTRPCWLKCALGSVWITMVEFFTGCLVNLQLHWNVWDYSERFLHLKGQICPLYSFLWFLLCFPLTALCATMQKRRAWRPKLLKKSEKPV